MVQAEIVILGQYRQGVKCPLPRGVGGSGEKSFPQDCKWLRVVACLHSCLVWLLLTGWVLEDSHGQVWYKGAVGHISWDIQGQGKKRWPIRSQDPVPPLGRKNGLLKNEREWILHGWCTS